MKVLEQEREQEAPVKPAGPYQGMRITEPTTMQYIEVE